MTTPAIAEPSPRVEPWWARPARLALVFILGVYTVVVLGVLVLVAIDRVRVTAAPGGGLSADDKASLALEHADRILGLLEVVLGMIALVLPLALGVIVYIFQQNRRTIEELTKKAERAETNAARSEHNVEAYREDSKEIDKRVNEAIKQLELGAELDRMREEAARKQNDENLKRDLARDDAARQLQEQIAAQKREVVDLSLTAEQLLNQSRSAQHKLTKVDEFLEIRKHSVMCISESAAEATTAVLKLMQIAEFPAPVDDDDDYYDPLRAEYDMLLRREALRALTNVREAAQVPKEISMGVIEMLQTLCNGNDHLVLRLEAKRTLTALKG